MRKTTISTLILVLIMCCSNALYSQVKKSDTVSVKTSAVCDMCKERLETGLAFEKGVKDVTLDSKTKVLTVVYNPKSTSAGDIRKKVTKLGYDADDLPAEPAAYDKLPACCKKGVAPH